MRSMPNLGTIVTKIVTSDFLPLRQHPAIVRLRKMAQIMLEIQRITGPLNGSNKWRTAAMKSKIVAVALLFALFLIAPPMVFSQDYKIGVLANRGTMQALKEWKATADYLSAKTGKPFTIVPLEYDQVPVWTKEGKIDFLLSNSANYVELNKLYGVQAVATQLNQYNKQPLDKFASVILVKADSPVSKLADLKGIDFACASRAAFGGWLMTVRLLMESGINPDTDLKSLRELKTHDNVVYAVQNGAVAAGSVRSGTLESMVRDGKVKASDFKIVRPLTDDFPLAHSTQAYPEYPFAACQHVPPDLRAQVGKALVAIQSTDSAAVDAKIHGWTEPLDYKSVVECLTVIKYGAFKDARLAAPPAPAPEEEKQTAVTQSSTDPGQGRTPARSQKGRSTVP